MKTYIKNSQNNETAIIKIDPYALYGKYLEVLWSKAITLNTHTHTDTHTHTHTQTHTHTHTHTNKNMLPLLTASLTSVIFAAS